MRWLENNLILVFWLTFIVYWRVMAANVKPATRLEPAASRITRAVLFIAAIFLIAMPGMPFFGLERRLMPPSSWGAIVGTALTALGLLFAIWARHHLGANWSRAVTIKQDHELITTGPYRVVRHPIYTGLLAAFAGTAIAEGQIKSLVAVALVFISLWTKLRLEEHWMSSQFGDSWHSYATNTAALVPGIL